MLLFYLLAVLSSVLVGVTSQSDNSFKNEFCGKTRSDRGAQGTAECMKTNMPAMVVDAWITCKVEINGGQPIECPQFVKKMCDNRDLFNQLEMCMDRKLKGKELDNLEDGYKKMMTCIQNVQP